MSAGRGLSPNQRTLLWNSPSAKLSWASSPFKNCLTAQSAASHFGPCMDPEWSTSNTLSRATPFFEDRSNGGAISPRK